MRYGLRGGYRTGRHWMRHRTCGAKEGISGLGARMIGHRAQRAYHPPWVSFSFASSSSLPGSGQIQPKFLSFFSEWSKARTGIEQRNLAGVGFPKILSLVECPLWSGPLFDVWIGRIRHDRNKYA